MLMTKLNVMAVLVLVAGLLTSGSGTLAQETRRKDRPKPAPTVSGKLETIDAGKNSVVVSTFSRAEGRSEKTFEVSKDAKIVQHGKEAKLSDLKKGDQTTLTLSTDQKTVVSIVVGTPPSSVPLKSVDAEKNTITVVTGGGRREKQDKTYQVAKDAKITIDGKEAKLTDLKEGAVLRLSVDEEDKVTQVQTQAPGRRKRSE
jgi:hypothetical protein